MSALKYLTLTPIGILMSLAIAPDTSAQETGTERSAVLEEILVTAEKRGERSIQEVPFAMNAFDADTIRVNDIEGLHDVSFMVPNFFVNHATGIGLGSGGFFFMRGNGTDNSQYTTDSAIGLYVDGVYKARAFGNATPYFDAERIEVIRGPQGTLYGRNSSAGALRVISKLPSLTEQSITGAIGTGTASRVYGTVGVSAPIVENTLGIRIAARHEKYEGQQRNSFIPGDRAHSLDVSSARVSLLWQSTDTFDLILRGDVTQDSSLPPATLGVPVTGAIPSDLSTFSSNKVNTSRINDEGLSLTANWELAENIVLTSITAYRTVDTENALDLDGGPTIEFESDFDVIDESQFTQEIYFASNSSGGLPLDWVVGAFYFEEDVDEVVQTTFGDNVFFPGSGGFSAPADRSLAAESVSVYGELTWHLTDDLAITGGGRWTDDDKHFQEVFSATDVRFTDENSTWRVGLEWRAGESLLVFGSAGTGFRSGGFDINSGSEFPTEEVDAYEIGIKSDWLDQRLRLNLTYFFNDYVNLQDSILGDNPFGLDTTSLDGESSGFEFEFQFVPVEGLNIMANAATLDTEIDKVGFPPGLVRKQSPEFSYRFGVDYTVEMGGGGQMTLGANYSWQDDWHPDVLNPPARLVPSFGLANARASYRTANERWEFALGIENLTDEDQPTHSFIFPFSGLSLPQSYYAQNPRMWKFDISFNL